MKVYIYGAHVKVGYFKEYSTFLDLYEEGMPKKRRGIEFLVNSKSKFKPFDGDIFDDLGIYRKLNSYAEYRSGNANTKLKDRMMALQSMLEKQYGKNVTIICNQGYITNRNEHNRVVLMNDEVMWQWNTGSQLYYRFENTEEAKKFYIHCLHNKVDGKIEINTAPSQFKYMIGSWRIFLLNQI